MPASDVTIEVEFLSVSVNPKTADIAIILTVILATLSFFLILSNYKKIKGVA